MSRIMNISSRILVSLIFVVSFFSCSGYEGIGDGNMVLMDYPVNLTTGTGADTRLGVDGLALAWDVNDILKITAVATDGSSAVSELNVYQIDENDPSCASFSGFVSLLAPPQDCYFLYPNSAATSFNQTSGRVKIQYNSQTGRHEPMMYAKAVYDESGMHVDLKHAGAVLQLDVQIPDLASITFAGNNLENIYPVEVDAETGETFSTNEVGVQITVPVQAEGPTYICVPPVKLEDGFSLICSKAGGSYIVKTFSSDGSLDGGYDFSDKVGSLIPITLSGEFEAFSITATSLSGNHTKNGNLISGTEVKFNMNRTGASNKIIEEWGANLLNAAGQVVRTISYTNQTPISGQSVRMNVANNWKLLPAGEYIFTPYYKMYGQVVTLPSQILNLADPGVKVTLNGSTSHDKYLSGNVSGANSHTNTLIEGVSVTTNLDLSIIDSRDLILDKSSKGAGTWSSGTASYGNFTMTEFRSYACSATVKVGNLTFTDSRDFHITGLPIEVDFTSTNPNNFNPSWILIGNMKYSDSRVNYVGPTASEATGALVTPKFWTANSSIVVKTSFYSCGKNVDFKLFGKVLDKEAYLDIYVGSCAAAPSSVSMGSRVVRSDYKTSYSNGEYLDWTGDITLNSSKPSLMYSATSTLYDKALYKVRVHYY